MKMSAQGNAVKVAAASAALLVAAPAFAADAEAGEKIFSANCAACHAGGQNSVVPDHTLEKAAIEKVRRFSLRFEDRRWGSGFWTEGWKICDETERSWDLDLRLS
jgi:mono/diheme cytochrome c family protein